MAALGILYMLSELSSKSASKFDIPGVKISLTGHFFESNFDHQLGSPRNTKNTRTLYI